MKIIKNLAALLLLTLCATPAHAFDLKGLLGGDTGETLTNILEGVFTKSNLEVSDLAGTWQSTGSAVTFKSENFLQQAGGIAGAAAIETKLNPYYEKYGLIGSTLEIDNDGNFTMKVKRLTLSGTITKGDGVFIFNFKVLGGMNIGQMDTYVEKSPSNLNVMFDATKLKTLMSTVAKFSGMSMAKTLSTMLDSYDGACVGFKMKQIAAAASTSTGSGSVSTTSSEENSGTNLLRSILNKKK